MELIRLIFFVLGAFFGIENSKVVAEKTTVTISPETKTIVIYQENIFTVIEREQDSINIVNELKQIVKNDRVWDKALQNYQSKSITFSTPENKSLNAKITLKYTTKEELSAFHIDVTKEGNYAYINVSDFNLQTTDGKLNGKYWYFDAAKTFKFTFEPFLKIPEKYKVHKKSLYPIWKAIQKE